MPNPNDIKNYDRRKSYKRALSAASAQLKAKRRKEHDALGLPALKPKTQDDLRTKDDTRVLAGDDEIERADDLDEFSAYFPPSSGSRIGGAEDELSELLVPKLFITTRPRCSKKMMNFVNEFMQTVPNCFFYKRGQNSIKEITTFAQKHKFTHLFVFGEKSKKANSVLISHLHTSGPTMLFKISNVKFRKEIGGHGTPTEHLPELILNNFNSRVGHRVGRCLTSLFPLGQSEFDGRNVVTVHNQRDFLFFRHHRYVFDANGKKASLQELGPQFTLKLKWILQGLFDTQHGSYEFIASKETKTSKELNASQQRRKFAM